MEAVLKGPLNRSTDGEKGDLDLVTVAPVCDFQLRYCVARV